MYTFEVFFYTISSVIQSNGSIDLRLFSVFRGFNVWAVLLILLQSFLGFGIGFVLKFFDVILGLQGINNVEKFFFFNVCFFFLLSLDQILPYMNLVAWYSFSFFFLSLFFSCFSPLKASSIATALNICISIKFFQLHASPLFFFGSLLVVAVSEKANTFYYKSFLP